MLPPVLKIAALALAVTGAAAAQSGYGDERFRDWSRVHKLRPDQQVMVRPFKGMGDEVFAAYVSSDATGIVVRLGNDQELEISKDRIQSVLRRKRMRNAVLIGAGAGFAVMALWTVVLPVLPSHSGPWFSEVSGQGSAPPAADWCDLSGAT